MLWDRRCEFDLFASAPVLTECAADDAEAASKRLAALQGFHLLEITAHGIELAKDLVAADIVSSKVSEHALHISIVAVHFVDYWLAHVGKQMKNLVLAKNSSRKSSG